MRFRNKTFKKSKLRRSGIKMNPLLLLLDDLEAKAKAATPGPWIVERTADSNWVGTPKGNGQKVEQIILHNERESLKEIYLKRNDNDADYIAACSPETVLALITALREARELAEYYADENLYEVKERIAQTEVGIVPYESVDVDDGEKARAFLKKWGKE